MYGVVNSALMDYADGIFLFCWKFCTPLDAVPLLWGAAEDKIWSPLGQWGNACLEAAEYVARCWNGPGNTARPG